MRRVVCFVAALFAASAAQAETIAIVHAKAYTMAAAAPVENATIVIDTGKIVSVTAGGATPARARVIDAGGRIVTPGLMNAAAQLGLSEINSVSTTVDHVVSGGTLGAAFDIQYALNPNSALIELARADGVTRALSYPSSSASSPFTGQAALIQLRRGDILDKPKAAMFVVIGGTSKGAGGSRAAQWLLLRNALDEAQVYRSRPAGALAPRDQLLNRLDIAALGPVLAGTMPLAITTDRESDIRQAIRLAADYRLRVVIISGAEAWRAADALAAARIPVILDPEDNLPYSFDEIGARSDNAALLQNAGVTIAFTTGGGSIHLNYNAGSMLREGAGVAVANGLPYGEALKAVTVNAARIWGMGQGYGTLSPGAAADIVIWDGDPLEPTSAPTAMLINGREVSLETRQAALQRRYAPARASDPLPPGYR